MIEDELLKTTATVREVLEDEFGLDRGPLFGRFTSRLVPMQPNEVFLAPEHARASWCKSR